LNLDSSFPQFYETGLEDLCGYAVLKRRVLKPSFLIRSNQPNGIHRNYLIAFDNYKALKKGKVMGNYQSV
jgi:hypothetical protein